MIHHQKPQLPQKENLPLKLRNYPQAAATADEDHVKDEAAEAAGDSIPFVRSNPWSNPSNE
jgi:hypothetical protein